MSPPFPSASGYPSASNHPSSSNHPSASGQSPAMAPPLPIRRRAETPNPPADAQDPRASRTRTMPPSKDKRRAAPRLSSPMRQESTPYECVPDRQIPRRDFFARFLAASQLPIESLEAVVRVRTDLLCGFLKPAEESMPAEISASMRSEEELAEIEAMTRRLPLIPDPSPDSLDELRSTLCQDHWDKSQELATRNAEILREIPHYQEWQRAIHSFMLGVICAAHAEQPVPGVMDSHQLGHDQTTLFLQLEGRIKNLMDLCLRTRNIAEFMRKRDAIISANPFAATQPGSPSSLES